MLKTALHYELDRVSTSIRKLPLHAFIDTGVRASDTSTCLTLSTTKQGMDLGSLVVPFDQTFPPLHLYYTSTIDYILINGNKASEIPKNYVAKIMNIFFSKRT